MCFLVRIVKDWTYPNIMRQTPSFSCLWNSIKFTEDEIEDCDLLIVLNAPIQNLKVRCREAWLMSQESPVEMYRWHTEYFKYFDKVFSFWDKSVSKNIIHEQTSLPWHINKSYDELIKTDDFDLSLKKNSVSWITSNASKKEGHFLRLDFMKYLQDVGFKFELFGKGFAPIDDKFDGIYPHKYSIAIENYSCGDYWTEKISDCFLSFTMPIYYGSQNILNYFPKESIILIDPNKKKESLEQIKYALNNDLWSKNLNYVKASRDLILYKYQFFPNIADKISKYNILNKKKKLFKVRKKVDKLSFFEFIKKR